MALTQLIFRIMKAATVHETESIRPTSIETTHTPIHIMSKHYLQFYAPLGFFFICSNSRKTNVSVYAE
jgi:hypothetical protein